MDGPDEVYRGVESPMRPTEGYRIVWIWSSQKCAEDQDTRQRRTQRAITDLEHLRAGIHAPRSRVKTLGRIQEAAAAVLAHAQADRWITTEISTLDEHDYRQAQAGRPSKDTQYVRHSRQRSELHWHAQADALHYDDRTDGIFPLIFNDEQLSLGQALIAYKHQPSLEKRHEQFESVFEVMPVILTTVHRIEAFLFIYFLALLTEALVKRELRRQMKAEQIPSLPLYPEGRPCKAPTTDRIFHLFEDVGRHRSIGPGRAVQKRFYDKLTPLQCMVLRLLGLSPTAYFAAGDPGAP